VSIEKQRTANIPTGAPRTGASNARGYKEIAIFDQNLALSPTWWKLEP